MSTVVFKTPDEIQTMFGEHLRRLRLQRNKDQVTIAAKAGISERALRSLEAGEGSKLITLIRVLKALEMHGCLEALVPEPSVSPMAFASFIISLLQLKVSFVFSLFMILLFVRANINIVRVNFKLF